MWRARSSSDMRCVTKTLRVTVARALGGFSIHTALRPPHPVKPLPMQQGQERRDRAPRAPTGTGGVHTVTQTLPDGSKRKFKMIGSARTGAEELDRTCEHAGHWSQMPPPAELCSTLNSITMRLLQLFDKAVQVSTHIKFGGATFLKLLNFSPNSRS